MNKAVFTVLVGFVGALGLLQSALSAPEAAPEEYASADAPQGAAASGNAGQASGPARGASPNLPIGDGAGPGAFFDLQNVQVLKGPQGTLFGRNTTGGAILIVPQKPASTLEGYVEGSLGNYNMKRVQGV